MQEKSLLFNIFFPIIRRITILNGGFFMSLRDEILETIAKELYWARTKKGLTKRAAAKGIGITENTLRTFEKGEGMPNGSTRTKLKKFYPGVLDEIF